ncbi:MAG: response regulator [Anaerolineae bacterium]|jgi:two-component system cell cycle response regulator DivK|nr:response regulator [Anaerolineae bacterium]
MDTTILYVEDNPQNMRLVRKMLNSAGFDMLEAQDGFTGIEMALQHNPTIILMDMNLPDIDGLEVTARLREYPQFAHTPIIALTANAMHGDRERITSGGCDGYLAKPITRNELVNMVNRFLVVRQTA